MTKKNHASLRISSGHYRIADLVIAIALIFAAIIGGYYVITENSRDYWLLLVVGIIGSILMFRKSRQTT